MGEKNINEAQAAQNADWESLDEETKPADVASDTQLGEIATNQEYEKRRNSFLDSLNSKDNFVNGWENCDDVGLLLEVAQKSGVSKDTLTWALYKAAEEAASKDLYLTHFVKKVEQFHFGKGGPEEIQAIQEMVPVVIDTALQCKEKGRDYGWFIYWVGLLAVKNIIHIPEAQMRQLEFTPSTNDMGNKKIFKEVGVVFKEQLRFIIDDIQKGYLANSSHIENN